MWGRVQVLWIQIKIRKHLTCSFKEATEDNGHSFKDLLINLNLFFSHLCVYCLIVFCFEEIYSCLLISLSITYVYCLLCLKRFIVDSLSIASLLEYFRATNFFSFENLNFNVEIKNRRVVFGFFLSEPFQDCWFYQFGNDEWLMVQIRTRMIINLWITKCATIFKL